MTSRADTGTRKETKELVDFVGRNALSLVGDTDDQIRPVAREAKGSDRARMGVFECIAQLPLKSIFCYL